MLSVDSCDQARGIVQDPALSSVYDSDFDHILPLREVLVELVRKQPMKGESDSRVFVSAYSECE